MSREMSNLTFVYLTRPTKPNFLNSISENDKEVLSEHFEYLQNALNSKQLVLAGPCTDAAFGIVIFESESAEAANLFMKNDPAIKAGIFSGELRPYRISLLRELPHLS